MDKREIIQWSHVVYNGKTNRGATVVFISFPVGATLT